MQIDYILDKIYCFEMDEKNKKDSIKHNSLKTTYHIFSYLIERS